MKILGTVSCLVADCVTDAEFNDYISKFGKQNIIDNTTIFCPVSKLDAAALTAHQKFFGHKLEGVEFVIASI
jgi:hypothetical protein